MAEKDKKDPRTPAQIVADEQCEAAAKAAGESDSKSKK